MSINMLKDELPKSVRINGKAYPIAYGFKESVQIEIYMFSDMGDEEKLLRSLNIFYKNNIPSDINQAMEQLLWFYNCGKTERKIEEQKTEKRPKKQQRRAYCFETDASRIYAAFRSQYSVNLNEMNSNELHWWEFMAMFESLSEDLLISRIMYYRTADLSGMGKNQKAFIKRMRSLYEIKHDTSSLDSRAKLAKRNKDMKDYVRRRMEECKKR